MKLSKDDKSYQVKLTSLKAEKQQDLEAVDAYEKKSKKKKKKKKTVLSWTVYISKNRPKKTKKSMIDFDEEHTNCTKSLAIEKNQMLP